MDARAENATDGIVVLTFEYHKALKEIFGKDHESLLREEAMILAKIAAINDEVCRDEYGAEKGEVFKRYSAKYGVLMEKGTPDFDEFATRERAIEIFADLTAMTFMIMNDMLVGKDAEGKDIFEKYSEDFIKAFGALIALASHLYDGEKFFDDARAAGALKVMMAKKE